MDDQIIISLFEKRDESAVSNVYQKYGNYCFQIAWNILKNEEDTKECINDTWMKVWDSIPPQKPHILSAFLAKIVRNLALDKYRKMNAQKRHTFLLSQPIEELEEVIASEHCLDENLNHQSLVTEINQFLAAQKQIDRIIFVRRYFFMDDLKQIEKIVSCKESTIKGKLFRMRKQLKQYLIQEGLYNERL